MFESQSIDHEKLLDILDNNREQGISLFALSRATGTSLHQLQKYFRAHKYVFQAVPIGRNYRLNQKAPYYGNVEKIRHDLQQEIAREQNEKYMAYGALGFACLYSLLLPFFLAV